MKEYLCNINLFNLTQSIFVRDVEENNDFKFLTYCDFDELTDTLADLSSNNPKSKIYLSNLGKFGFKAFKELILENIATKYSNTEVEIIELL